VEANLEGAFTEEARPGVQRKLSSREERSLANLPDETKRDPRRSSGWLKRSTLHVGDVALGIRTVHCRDATCSVHEHIGLTCLLRPNVATADERIQSSGWLSAVLPNTMIM